MDKKKIVVNPGLIIVSAFMLAFFGLYFLKGVFFAVIPGIAVMFLFFRKTEFNKMLLLSFPLSLVFFIFPFFIFSKLSIAVPSIYFYIIPLISLIYILMNVKISFNFKFKIDFVIALILFAFVSNYIFEPYKINNAIPLTGGTRAFVSPLFTLESIKETGKVPFWFSNWYSGSPHYMSYSPLTHLTTSIFGLMESEPFFRTVNLTYIFCAMFFAYGCYMLFRRFGLNPAISILACIIVVSTPFLSGDMSYKGNLVSSFMLAFFPGVIYFLIESFNEKSVKNVLLYSVNLFAFVLSYYFDLYFCLFVFAVLIIIYLAKSKTRKLVLRNSLLYFIVPFILSMAWSLPFIVHNSEFPLEFREGGWNNPLPDLNAFLDLISHPLNENEIGTEQGLVTFSPIIFWLGLASFVFLVIFRKDKNKILLSNAILFTLLAIMVVEIVPGHTIIPLRDKFYGHYRSWHLMIPFFALNIGFLLETIKEFSKKHMKKTNFIVPFIVLLFIYPVINYSNAINSRSIAETAAVDISLFQDVYSALSSGPEGRIIEYGIFGPAILWAIPRWTDMDMFAGYGFERHCMKTVYTNNILQLQQGSNDYLLGSASENIAYNMYYKTHTSKILFNLCSQSGYDALNRTILVDEERYGVYYQSPNQCFVIAFPFNISSYAEVPVLTGIFTENREEIISEILNLKNGYVYTMLLDETLNENEYDVVIKNQSDIQNLIYSDNDIAPVQHQRTKEDEIRLYPNDDGWILVKEAYMSKWNAYQNGNKLEIHQTYLGYMLINSQSNSEIILKLEPDMYDYIGALSSAVMLIVLFFVFKT
ncbi:MAG: hypothetical protein PHW96_02570 [Candidatus Nanoarchaeia archaeon]|nr:hypothetical protein [Candidatus Nanoarchaeia archaeon]